jgi:hypothetical protein
VIDALAGVVLVLLLGGGGLAPRIATATGATPAYRPAR